MATDAHDRSSPPGMFPSSDQFPLGRAYGYVAATPQPASTVRPFGLILAVTRGAGAVVDSAELGYDGDVQVGLIRHGADMVTLSKRVIRKSFF